VTDIIADLPIDERPRERLLRHGPETLSNAELVAILLGCGVRGKNAIQLARALLVEGVAALGKRDPRYLQEVCGVGPAKAARLMAAFEICRRISEGVPEEPPVFDRTIFGTQLVTAFAHHTQEHLGAAFLDSRHRIVGQRDIYIGTINNALVSTRDILRHALLDRHASAVVIYHNHPSGDPTPSEEDFNFTKKLKVSLSYIDIELVDHLVIGMHRYYSMQAKGEL
jgi:DNA repair protein RadC